MDDREADKEKETVIVERESWLVDPGVPIPEESSAIHGIKDDDVRGKPTFVDVFPRIHAMLEGAIPAGYNAEFDRAFLRAVLEVAARPELALTMV